MRCVVQSFQRSTSSGQAYLVGPGNPVVIEYCYPMSFAPFSRHSKTLLVFSTIDRVESNCILFELRHLSLLWPSFWYDPVCWRRGESQKAYYPRLINLSCYDECPSPVISGLKCSESASLLRNLDMLEHPGCDKQWASRRLSSQSIPSCLEGS